MSAPASALGIFANGKYGDKLNGVDGGVRGGPRTAMPELAPIEPTTPVVVPEQRTA